MRKKLLLLMILSCLVKNTLNAQYWSTLGEGIGYPDGLGTVYSLAMYNGELYAAGNHTYDGGTANSKILKWDGNNWGTIGEATNNLNETGIYSFAVFNGELYAAGYFSAINNVSANGIAKWNGTMWSSVGSGTGFITAPLIVFDSELYAAGAAGVVKWNGTSWLPVGNVLIAYVSCFAIYDGELYATGIYQDNTNNSSFCGITKWDGTNWIPLNCQLNTWAWINTMIEYNGELYAGGNFDSIGGIAANHIAKWNGTNWSSIGTGLGLSGSSVNQVFSLTIHKNSIHAAGFFTTTDSTACKNIAKWDGSSWIGLGNGLGDDFEEEVYAIISNDTILYAGGNFNTAGNVSARHIAKWKDQCSIAPVQPGNISGDTTGCQDNYLTYSVYPVNDAAGYIWTLPTGWTCNSFFNTITALTNSSDGNITVAAYNPCGISDAQILAYTVTPIPLRPATINGNDTVCQGTPQIYSIDSVPGATSYTWTIPAGWSVSTGSGWGYGSTQSSVTLTTNHITIKANDKNGSLSVTANNGCGSSDFQTIGIYVNRAPQLIGAISGDVIANMGHTYIYSINQAAGVTTYTWSLSGGGTVVSGQGTNQVSVKWETPGDFTLSVALNHDCAANLNQNVKIKVLTPDVYNPFNIKLLPNPSSGEFYIKAKGVQNQVINVEIFNMSGQLVFHTSNRAGTNDYSQLINLDKMAQGIYAVEIIIDGNVYTKQILITN